MNKNKYIATHHYRSGETELLNFEQFKDMLLNLMDYEIKRFTRDGSKENTETLISLEYWRTETSHINDFNELLRHYQKEYSGIDMFDYIDLNVSEIYEFDFSVETTKKAVKYE